MRNLFYSILLYLGIVVLLSNCSNSKMNSTRLCKEFYLLNNKKNFDGLSGVIIGKGRVTNVYDSKTQQYDLVFKSIDVYDTASKEFISLPIFDPHGSNTQSDSILNTFSPQLSTFLNGKFGDISKNDFLSYYNEYINNILKYYHQIETPKWFSSKNVPIDGNPTLGKFITFILDDKCKCYYVIDQNSLDSYWSNYFKKITRLDEHWFYETEIE